MPAPSSPPVRARMLWTWDHSTEWVLNARGAQTFGASNHYGRDPEVFESDYTNLLRWCGQHGIDAVVVWGLLRDAHGGVESVRRLCETAAEEGVRLLCGVGLNAYGGVYYEGESPYSLDEHLKKHPDLVGRDLENRPMVRDFGLAGRKTTYHACPSRRENQEFAAESLQWLLETLPLGGVQMEAGDTGVCQCELCRERRQHPSGASSWEDMALMYPMAAAAIRSVSADPWIVCETYQHPEPFAGPHEHPSFGEGKPAWADECLAEFPDDVFVQWTCDRYVSPSKELAWTRAGAVSSGSRRHIMRAHFGTYWGGMRGEMAVDWIAEMVQRSMASGYDTVSIFGEVSPFHTGAELNYLALEHFGSEANPTASVDAFVRDVAAPLLGGEQHARDYLRYARLRLDRAAIPAALADIQSRVGQLSSPCARRWMWLANYLASLGY